MTATTGRLRRYVDKSEVSGTGDVAEFAEFSDGAVAVRWHGDHPSTAAWNDIRDVEVIHGHKGATEILFDEKDRLLTAYETVVPWMITARHQDQPILCAAHPMHPDRLRMVFTEERPWRFWIALLDGSTDAAVHEDIAGETEHRWVSADGNLWLVYHTRHSTNPGLTWESHDDPEVN